MFFLNLAFSYTPKLLQASLRILVDNDCSYYWLVLVAVGSVFRALLNKTNQVCVCVCATHTLQGVRSGETNFQWPIIVCVCVCEWKFSIKSPSPSYSHTQQGPQILVLCSARVYTRSPKFRLKIVIAVCVCGRTQTHTHKYPHTPNGAMVCFYRVVCFW